MALEQHTATAGEAATVPKGALAHQGQHDLASLAGATCAPANGQIDGRNARLTTWFETWQLSMRRWVSSRSSIQSADLDDVAQEVFLRLLRYSDNAVVEHPQSYLFRIATNVVNEWRERARNCLPHDDAGLEDLPIESHDEPESFAERRLVDERVRSAVRGLPPRIRDVVVLHIEHDLTYKQIAARLKVTPRMVRRDVAAGYARLRAELGTVDLDSFRDLKPTPPDRVEIDISSPLTVRYNESRSE